MMVTVTQATSQSNSLIDYVKQVFIIAYKEPTEALESCFREEGFNCEVLRQKHLEEYKGYSNSYLTLLNHCQAWQRIIQENKPTLIIEADFVPVVGISQLPLPFNPRKKKCGYCLAIYLRSSSLLCITRRFCHWIFYLCCCLYRYPRSSKNYHNIRRKN
jgi:hypothetical protein